MRILQFASMQEPEIMARLIRLTGRGPATVVLDLEDGLWDVTDETDTSALKAAGRANLITLGRTHPELFARQPIGVRMNRSSGPDAALDLDALAEVSRFVEFECVVPTKVETGAEVEHVSGSLRSRRVAFRSLVPIVETRRGLANVDGILEAARHLGIEWLAYGHFDFALDSNWWPFPEPSEPRYWERIEPLIRRWESAGMGYVHPPYFQTHDEAGLASIIGRLRQASTREFGIITVGPRQTRMADRLSNGRRVTDDVRAPMPPVSVGPPNEAPADLARHIVQTFLATRRHPGGFALDTRTGEFISPHVYLAADAYLRRVGSD
ncbi:MAG: hypothetical protein V4515_06830 [Chloroflexota bacterium]